MNGKSQSVSSDSLTNCDKDKTVMSVKLGKHKQLSPEKWDSMDSGFVEQKVDGSPENRRHSMKMTHGECPRYETDRPDCRGEQTTLADDTDVESLEGDYTFIEDTGQTVSASGPNVTKSEMTSSYVEISTICETENMCEKEVDIIIPEIAPRLKCPPKPIPSFDLEHKPFSENVMLKSCGQYLRAVEHIDKPMIIIDKLRKRFKNQYCFISETKVVVDEDSGTSHYLTCFRHDFDSKSFYLVPHKTGTGNRTGNGSRATTGTETGTGKRITVRTEMCPETIDFTCVEADKGDVVVDALSNRNSKFWYYHKSYPSPGVFQSLAHPKYFLSFEEDLRAVLRKTKDYDPEAQSFKIDIIEIKSSCSLAERFSIWLSSLVCSR